MNKTITIFGLGEAGSLLTKDLLARGMRVRGYDPAKVPTPEGMFRCHDPEQAVENSDYVFALTAAADAKQALEQALDAIPVSALYADFATASAGLKTDLAAKALTRNLRFADIALLAIMPGNGIRAKALASGSGADDFVNFMAPLGMPVTAISRQAGDAATRKLLRSVAMKGLAAVIIEAMRAGEKAGCAEWLWRNLSDQISEADSQTLARLVSGSKTHALRRLHEMEASTALLEELGVEPLMTRSTTENLRQIPELGLPKLPK